ncbi:uncharacterized protein BDV17DRAFT_285935 [Aspergillus undulatus]|uniref:uncharacterized protein n=1 Tax=Aspergillus undulatus TaxID=1810928 RepID=UPI003CCE230A
MQSRRRENPAAFRNRRSGIFERLSLNDDERHTNTRGAIVSQSGPRITASRRPDHSHSIPSTDTTSDDSTRYSSTDFFYGGLPPRRRCRRRGRAEEIDEDEEEIVIGVETNSTNWQSNWSQSTTKDVTIHFAMEVSDDIDSLIDEFSRLKRLGDFSSAEQYFQSNLEPFLDTLPVAIEYADMLVEQGAYGRVHEFMSSQRIETLVRDCAAVQAECQPEMAIYMANLDLIMAFSAMHSHKILDKAYKTVRSVEITMRALFREEKGERPIAGGDSGVIQVTRYALKILSHVEREADLVPEHHFDYWSNWAHYYRPLADSGRVWDARDIILASIEAEGVHKTWGMVFNEGVASPKGFVQLYDDWDMGAHYDESTYLAVLEILVGVGNSLSQYWPAIPDKSDLIIAQRCLQQACSLATCLKENNPELTRSRPYLRWVLAEEQIKRKLNPGPTDLQTKLGSYPGITIWPTTLPIYVPIKTENPVDHHAQILNQKEQRIPSTSDDKLLEAAVAVARKSADYATEVRCVAELLYRCMGTPRADNHLSRMCDLQVDLQGDRLGRQRTLLSKYLYAMTDNARRELLADLRSQQGRNEGIFHGHRREHGDGDDERKSTYDVTDWCAFMLEKALYISLDITPPGSPFPLRNLNAPYLPQYVKYRLVDAGLGTIYGLRLEGLRRDPSILFPLHRFTTRNPSPDLFTQSTASLDEVLSPPPLPRTESTKPPASKTLSKPTAIAHGALSSGSILPAGPQQRWKLNKGPNTERGTSQRYRYCIHVDKEALDSIVHNPAKASGEEPDWLFGEEGYVNLIDGEWELWRPWDPDAADEDVNFENLECHVAALDISDEDPH